MITAGIDMGAKFSKVAILKDDKEILALAGVLTGFDQKAAAEEALKKACQKANISIDQIDKFVSTGAGKEAAPHSPKWISDVGAAGKGANFLFPTARTVADIGAEEGRAAKIDAKGNVRDFAVNEKCAAGAGTFIETMARALQHPIEEFCELSLKSTKSIPMNAQCVIFAESEVVSLIHAKTSHEDIARAIHDSIADRNAGLVRRVGVEEDVVLGGGMGYDRGFIDSLKRTLGVNILVPEQPEYISAIGAAVAHD